MSRYSMTAVLEEIIQYNAYRSLVSGGPYTLIGNSSVAAVNAYNDFAVNRLTTYYYVVTAHDWTNESVHSNEASATLPA